MAAPGEKSFCVVEYQTSKSVVTVRRAYCTKYAKDPPTDKTIRAWYKYFTETGGSVQAVIKWSPINRWRWRWTGSGQFLHSPKKSTGTAAKELSMSKNNSVEGSA
jgi:hypothetical protein